MLTPDVNVKTAASESSRKMGENTVNTVTQPTQVQKKLNDGYRRPWGKLPKPVISTSWRHWRLRTGAEGSAGSRSNRWSLRAGM